MFDGIIVRMYKESDSHISAEFNQNKFSTVQILL